MNVSLNMVNFIVYDTACRLFHSSIGEQSNRSRSKTRTYLIKIAYLSLAIEAKGM